MFLRRGYAAGVVIAALFLFGSVPAAFFPAGALSSTEEDSPPPPPRWTGIYDMQGKVALSWTFDPRYRAVRVYRRLAADWTKPFDLIAEVQAARYVDDDAEAGGTYLYRLVALLPNGRETESSADRAIEVAVTEVREVSPPTWEGQLQTERGIGLKWQSQEADDVLVYNVYRKLSPEEEPELIGSTGETLFLDWKVEPGRSYIYLVSALDKAFRESPLSEEVTVTFLDKAAAVSGKEEPEWRQLRTRMVKVVSGGKTPFLRPADVAVDPRGGMVYVTDSGNRSVEIFSAEGDHLRSVTRDQQGVTQFLNPLGLMSDTSGHFTVVDAAEGSLSVMNSKGKVVRRIDIAALFGKEPLGLIDAAASPKGAIFIVDNYNNRVAILDPASAGSTFGKTGFQPGAFSAPTFCAFDDKGFFYVSDALNGRVQVFDAEGAFVRSFGRYRQGPGGLGRPKGVAVGKGGRVFVADSWQNVIQVFDGEGKFLALLTDEQGEPLDLGSPNGIALGGGKGKRIYIVERLSNRLQIRDLIDDI